MTLESFKRLRRCLEEAKKINDKARISHYELKIEKEKNNVEY